MSDGVLLAWAALCAALWVLVLAAAAGTLLEVERQLRALRRRRRGED